MPSPAPSPLPSTAAPTTAARTCDARLGAPAPRLSSFAFAANGASATLAFDGPTDRAELPAEFPCDAVADFPGAAAARCAWDATAGAVVAALGGDATLAPGDAAAVAADVRRACVVRGLGALAGDDAARLCGCWPTANRSLAVAAVAPSQRVAVAAVLDAPGTVGACEAATLDASRSSGSGGRPFAANWTVDAPAGANASRVAAVLAAATGDRVALPADALAAVVAARLNVSVTLANFFGERASASAMLALPGVAVPALAVDGGAARTVAASDALRLVATARSSACAASSPLNFAWSVDGRPDLASTSADPAVFALAANALAAGDVVVASCRVADAATRASSTVSVTVTVAASPLVARINGAAAAAVAIGADDVLVLDGSGSRDPDGGDLAYAFACDGCALEDVDGSSASLRGADVAGPNATVALVVSSADGRGATATLVVARSAARAVPVASVAAAAAVVNADEAVAVAGAVDFASSNFSAAWEPSWKSTSGMDASSKTSNLSISVKSKSIRLIFGRIDCSRRVLEVQPKSLHRNGRIREH